MVEFKDLKDEVISRLDKIEDKLDRHMEQSNANKTDIAWVKGFIKISVTMLLGILGSLASYLLHLFAVK